MVQYQHRSTYTAVVVVVVVVAVACPRINALLSVFADRIVELNAEISGSTQTKADRHKPMLTC